MLYTNAFCLTITNLALQFIQVCQIHIAGAAEMPDAMEIIFQKALTVGKSGAVSIIPSMSVSSHLKPS